MATTRIPDFSIYNLQIKVNSFSAGSLPEIPRLPNTLLQLWGLAGKPMVPVLRVATSAEGGPIAEVGSNAEWGAITEGAR